MTDSETFLGNGRRIAALARRLAGENREAAALCETILSGPAVWWAQRLRATGRARTAGVVKRLLGQMRARLESAPEEAQVLTGLAVELAGQLDREAYPPVLLNLVQGRALRDHGYVLSFRGLYPEALESVERAETFLAGAPAAAYDYAQLCLVKASIFRNTGRTDEAVALTRQASETFLRFGDRSRSADARMTEGAVLYAAGAVEQALEVWRGLEDEPALDEARTLRLAHNIALCLSSLGQHAAALPYLDRCTIQFERLGMATERTRSRAALGKALLAAGRLPEALRILGQAGRELESLGLVFDAGLVALERAEALLASNEPSEVPAICRAAVAHFTRAGVASYAAAALAYLREAAALTPAAPKLVRDAHTSLRRLAAQQPRSFAATE